MSKTTLQLGASPETRGRVMALWGIAWQGSTPVGGPVVGLIGQQMGARRALATGDFGALAVGASTLVPWRGAGRCPAGIPTKRTKSIAAGRRSVNCSQNT